MSFIKSYFNDIFGNTLFLLIVAFFIKGYKLLYFYLLSYYRVEIPDNPCIQKTRLFEGVLLNLGIRCIKFFANYSFKLFHILVFTFFCGIFWEYIVPLYREDTVSDLFDIMAYLLGTLIFWYICDGKRLLNE